jgi:phosphopantothenoylcysteine decarboxylase/phosphopantothenate--cysteine ligase
MQFKGKKILLAVSGSIAVYKSLILTRLLIKNGAEVKVIMTPASTDFVSPLSFSTLSKNQVYSDVSSEDHWNNHVELGLWADVMIVAPVTATTMAKMVNGIADNMVIACYLSAKCPVFFAPAMDLDMWKHPSTQRNLEKLQSYGNHYIQVGKGELASGLKGEGRMAEPEEILEVLTDFLNAKKDLLNKKAIVTAGPTYEDLDPVRYIGNRSTGKMGIAIAEALASRGAEVTLVLGPSPIKTTEEYTTVRVRNAAQMYEAVDEAYNNCDIVVFAAAVADYKPQTIARQKIKKSDDDLSIGLERTVDIAKTIGGKKKKQFHIGFALETENGAVNAQAKLKKKNFDLIVLNTLADKGAGFAHDTNKISIYDEAGLIQSYPLTSKKKAAINIIDTLVSRL